MECCRVDNSYSISYSLHPVEEHLNIHAQCGRLMSQVAAKRCAPNYNTIRQQQTASFYVIIICIRSLYFQEHGPVLE